LPQRPGKTCGADKSGQQGELEKSALELHSKSSGMLAIARNRRVHFIKDWAYEHC
jgi:hypothetical protein